METYNHPIYKAWREKLQALGIPQVGGKDASGNILTVIDPLTSLVPVSSLIPASNRNDYVTFRSGTLIRDWTFLTTNYNYTVGAGSIGHMIVSEWGNSAGNTLETWPDAFLTPLYTSSLNGMTYSNYACLLFYDQNGNNTIDGIESSTNTAAGLNAVFNTFMTSRRDVYTVDLKGGSNVTKWGWNGSNYSSVVVGTVGSLANGFAIASDGVGLWFGWKTTEMNWIRIVNFGTTSGAIRKTNLSIALEFQGNSTSSGFTSTFRLSKTADTIL